MKDKVNELINAPVFNIFEAERVLQELSNKEQTTKVAEDFIYQLMSGCRTKQEFAEVASNLSDMIFKISEEIQDKRVLAYQNKFIKQICLQI